MSAAIMQSHETIKKQQVGNLYIDVNPNDTPVVTANCLVAFLKTGMHKVFTWSDLTGSPTDETRESWNAPKLLQIVSLWKDVKVCR